MLKALIKNRIVSFFAGFGYDKKTGKKRKVGMMVLFGVLYAYLIAVFLFLFGMFFVGLGGVALADRGSAWLYFAMAGLAAFVVSLVVTLFVSVAQLYEAKDNELLLSLPIPPMTVLLSRVVFLFVANLATQAIVLLPALGVYLFYSLSFGTFSVLSLLALLLSFVSLPLLSLSLSCLFGWLVALMLRRVKRRSLVQILFSFLFLGAYMYLYVSFLQRASELEDFALLIPSIASAMKQYFTPFYFFGVGCAESALITLAFLLAGVLGIALVLFALAKSFTRIVTAKPSLKKQEYREKRAKPASIRRALAKKDLSHLFHSSIYLMNAALGLVFLVVAAVALFICRNDFLALFQGPEMPVPLGSDEIALLLAGASCMLLSMNLITAPSVSLEGKSLWILRSAPLSGKDVLLSKVYASRVLAVPAAFLASLSIVIVTAPSLPVAIGVFLLPQAFATLGDLLGITFGVLFPRLSWLNEMEPVKQGMAVGFTMLSMMGATLLTFGVGFVAWRFLGSALTVWILTLLFAALCTLFLWVVLNPISRKFEKLYV